MPRPTYPVIWEDFCNKWLLRLLFCKLELAGASPFMDRDAQGNEYLRCSRPRLGRLLFRRVTVIGQVIII